jgi:uncharacterized protein Yka (UPF0111/DUF47 family)
MSNWTLKELEGQLSKLEAEIAVKEEAADELRREIWKLTPRAPHSPLMQAVVDCTKKTAERRAIFNLLDIPKQYDEHFGQKGAKIGTTIKIRLPNYYTAVTK